MGGEAQRTRLGVGQLACLVDERAEALQLGTVEAEPGARLEEHDVLAPGQRAEERLERDLLTLELDGHAQVEPVTGLSVARTGLGVSRAEAHDRGRRDLLVVGQVVVQLDRHVRVVLEDGQHIGKEGRGVEAPQHDAGGQRVGAVAITARRTGHLS